FSPGHDYPLPLVDLEQARRRATEALHQIKKSQSAQEVASQILSKHALPGRRSQ
ncbi:MAG: deoxyribodipyrimidine photolyase, partial [Bacteroidetes bacterium]